MRRGSGRDTSQLSRDVDWVRRLSLRALLFGVGVLSFFKACSSSSMWYDGCAEVTDGRGPRVEVGRLAVCGLGDEEREGIQVARG